jgi:colanic acid biosynthesis glycosyl transferase WcaI
MGAMLAMADLHLLPQIAGAADLVLPSKLTNMLASARPVVATTEPGTGLYAEVEGCGALSPPGEAAALAASIVRLADDPVLRAKLGAEARRRAEERWSKDAIIARAVSEMDRL